jgi:hypothetical protein
MSSSEPARVIVRNFSQFKLETHVQNSLQRAWSLAGGRPLNAGHLLKAALIEVRRSRSVAFLRLAALLPLENLEDVKTTDVPPADLGALPLTKPLADSIVVAEGFFRDTGEIWGRDYVTLALLAKDDPSLIEFESETNLKIQAVRDAWFKFVTLNDERRKHDAWQRWWRAAGVPLPSGEQATEAAGYLFTWNPKQFPFGEMEQHIQEIEKQGFSVFSWSVGNRRTIYPNARVFLLRQGLEPRGLVGVGEVQSEITEGPHWEKDKSMEGDRAFTAEVRWIALSRDPFLSLPNLMQQTANSAVWSSRASGIELQTELRQKLEEIWPRAWVEYRRRLQPLPEMEPKQWIARFDADRGGSTDSMRLERYIHAFARVMASQNLTPPLSIGLFGDWGSGKTFFMDCLFEKIDSLAKGDEVAGQSPLYWQKICQIRFNAWHYAETNLWASLVSTVFNELRFFLDGRKDDADEFNKLLNELELAGELRKEAQQKVDEATERHNKTMSNVKEAEERLRNLQPPPEPSDEQLRKILNKNIADFLKGADKNKIAGLLESAAEWSGRREFNEAAQRLKSGAETVREVAAVLEEVQSLASQTGFWWRVLIGAKVHKTRGFWIVLFALLAIPAIAMFASVHGMQQGWAHLWTLIGEIMTITGAIVAWIRSRLSGATTVFDHLRSLRANVERNIEEARSADRQEYEAKRDKALAEQSVARRQLEECQQQEQQAAEAERKAHEALREATSQARLGRFIRERASSADYEKHLGLIAVIHRDFERLSNLMEKARNNPSDVTIPRIDRIILYIDDLDRCYPPEKVVKILEAVHLLLFFPLFVVIVGVDSRWVSRSLHKHYEGMLADETTDADLEMRNSDRPPAESQDFLEKIFQVPFWLRRMEPNAVQRLIHSLISSSELETSPATSAQHSTAIPPETVADSHEATDDRSTQKDVQHTATEVPAGRAATTITREAESEKPAVGESLEAPSESLRITDVELSFMDKVAPLMSRTPRSVKRFVNIYRLYKAALSPLGFVRFMGTPDKPGNFRAVQVLLALVTGTPRFAQKIFHELHAGQSASGKRLSELAKIDSREETWQKTLQALREFAQGDCDLPLDALREVSPLVARYSLHHMMSSAPGEAGLG